MNFRNQSLTPLRLDFNNCDNDTTTDSHNHFLFVEKTINDTILVTENDNQLSKIDLLVSELSKTSVPRKKRSLKVISSSGSSKASESASREKRSSKDISSSGSGYPPISSHGFTNHYGRRLQGMGDINSLIATPDSNWTTWSRCDTRIMANHFPVSYNPEDRRRYQMKRRYCKMPSCKKQPSVYCLTCGVPLCITLDSNDSNCFIEFHSTLHLLRK